jgi:hypothetical protein
VVFTIEFAKKKLIVAKMKVNKKPPRPPGTPPEEGNLK